MVKFKQVMLHFLGFWPTPKGVSLSDRKHCMKHLVWSRAFTSVTYVRQYVTGVV